MRSDSFLSTPTRLRRRTPRRLLHCSSHCPPLRPLIALDSDGTVLDSMRPKHERCFAPLFAEYFAIGAPREVLVEVWLFVNLGSRNRGINRYRALSAALRLLAGHPRIGRPRGLWARVGSALDLWLAAESVPSRASLERAAAPGGTFPALSRVLEWSLAVDASIASLPPPPAFEGARNFVVSFKDVAELMVLSAAPRAAVCAEWEAAGLLNFADEVVGQESGGKAAALAARRGALRPALVVGDAMGDLEAARASGAAFFPIVPGREEESWSLLLEAGRRHPLWEVQPPGSGLFADFLDTLKSDPPWIVSGGRP